MILICINNDCFVESKKHLKLDKVCLTINKKYNALNESEYWNQVGIEIENDKGIVKFYNIERFEKLSDIRSDKIDKLLNK
jgi:hypothetical protein